MESTINELAEQMVKKIANKYIECQNKWEGMDKQRSAYKTAVKMLKRLMIEYREVIKNGYKTKELWTYEKLLHGQSWL